MRFWHHRAGTSENPRPPHVEPALRRGYQQPWPSTLTDTGVAEGYGGGRWLSRRITKVAQAGPGRSCSWPPAILMFFSVAATRLDGRSW